MKKQEDFSQLAITLTLIAVLAAALVGGVYLLTQKPIHQAAEQKRLEAIMAVVGSDFDNNPFDEKIRLELKDGSKIELYPARKDGNITALAVKSVSKKGFGGNIEMMVGIHIDGTINGYEILEQHETPGLGTKISESKFKNQFINLRPNAKSFTLKKDGGEIDAVTAATISSRAAVDALNKAYKGYQQFNSRK